MFSIEPSTTTTTKVANQTAIITGISHDFKSLLSISNVSHIKSSHLKFLTIYWYIMNSQHKQLPVGLIDRSLVDHGFKTHPSLNSIRFSGFIF